MSRRLRLLWCFLVFAPLLSAGEPAVLTIRVPEAAPLTFNAAELAALPRVHLEAVEPHAKTKHTYSGLSVRDLLIKAGAPLGAAMRGSAHRMVVRVSARDGYVAVFALAEFDEAFSSRSLLLATQVDGAPLPEKSAPLQLIAPGDKRGARWVRMVDSLEVITLPAQP